MKRRLGAGAVALTAIIVTVTPASAARRCARPSEVTAIQAAAIQQQLMVAALTCHDVAEYNAFQTSYSRELRRSDHRLKSMFIRLYGRRGVPKYHAFKTRLANKSSMRSIRNNSGYCQQAKVAFDAALGANKPRLADFVSSVPVNQTSPVVSCNVRMGMRDATSPNVVPKPNPLRMAQASASQTSRRH